MQSDQISGNEPGEDGGKPIGAENALSSSAFRTYAFRENLCAEFDHLVAEGKLLDGLVIDLTQVGYSLPLDTFVKFCGMAGRLLKPHGVLLFVKRDGAIALTLDDLAGGMTLNVFDSVFGIFTRHPLLADYACATISGIDRRRLKEGGNTLANHILFSSIPVLTAAGAEIKDSFQLPAPQNWLLQKIDDHQTTEILLKVMDKEYGVPSDETLRILQELESERIIFPLFSRIQFLSNCYHNRKPFRLGHYLVSSGFISQQQLEELLEIQQQEGMGRGHKTLIGLLAVKKGYLNERQLEILINDQYLYGGYHKLIGDAPSSGKNQVETVKDSMIGSLAAFDPAGLLQSLATAQKTGLLTVEARGKSFMAVIVDGKPTHGMLGKLKGYDAITEFLVFWKEGIFVFRDKGICQELDQSCIVGLALDRILLDSALHQDQVDEIISQLPAGKNVLFERMFDKESSGYASLAGKGLPMAEDFATSDKLLSLIDGWTTLAELVDRMGEWPEYKTIKHIQLLLEQGYIKVQSNSLFLPLTVFQKLASAMEKLVGVKQNCNLLTASLRYVHGDMEVSRRFHVDSGGHISVNFDQVKKSGAEFSHVFLELRRWMEAYIAYCRREIDPRQVDDLVAKVVHDSAT